MSTLLSKKPISVVIFDRTQAGESDVPIFARTLRDKINTPIHLEQTDVALSPSTQRLIGQFSTSSQEKSVFRADSSGGQTGEFAQSTEIQQEKQDPVPVLIPVPSIPKEEEVRKQEDRHSAEPVSVDRQIFSFLLDDPSLIRSHQDTQKLVDHVCPQGVGWATVPTVRINQAQTPFLRSSHRAGKIEILILHGLKPSLFTPYEERVYTLKRHLASFQKSIKNAPNLAVQKRATLVVAGSELRDSVRSLIQTQLASATQQIVTYRVKIAQISLPQFQFPHLSIPTISLPKMQPFSIHIPQVSMGIRGFSLAQFTSRFLMVSSIVLMLLTVGPVVLLEAQSWKHKIVASIQNLSTRADENTSSPTEVKPTPIPTPNPAPEKQFQLSIPKIGLNSKVIANVDAGNEKEYGQALQKGVAHAAGTGLPGEENSQNKTIFIFGHSTNGTWNISRYNALFYSLKDLIIGDTFSVWFWGKEFQYKVKETKIVEANDVSFLVPQTSKDQLILQTCWPPGTTWKRLIVISEPTE